MSEIPLNLSNKVVRPNAVVANLFSVVDPFDDLAESCEPHQQSQSKPLSRTCGL